jgi:hypothetical protein
MGEPETRTKLETRIQAIIAEFKDSHPAATRVQVTTVTRKKVYLRYESPALGAMGLYVKAVQP